MPYQGFYNCMGYALGRKEWLVVRPYSDGPRQLEQRYNLKLVSKQDMKLGKKYIGYKYGASDFHFVRRDEKGHWTHKMGTYKIEPISRKKVFADEWVEDWATYNSKLYLFEVLD